MFNGATYLHCVIICEKIPQFNEKKRHRQKRYILVVVRLMSRHNATINISQLYLKLVQLIPDGLILQLEAHHLSILVVVVLQVYTQYHSINAYNSPEGNYILHRCKQAF